jgi:hypothetical protein
MRLNPLPLRHVLALGLVLAFSFVVNQSPFAFSRYPKSVGVDGDSWVHVAIQMKLADNRRFAGDLEVSGFYLQARAGTEYAVHRAVAWLSMHVFAGDFLLANIATHWVVATAFLSGCIALGLVLGLSLGGATVFAIASAGLSAAPRAWWGVPFGAVIPHDIGLATVPWILWAYLHLESFRHNLALFLAMGLSANVYALQPFLLAVILLATWILTGRGVVQAIVLGAVFAIGALPVTLGSALPAVSQVGSTAQMNGDAFATLLERHYWYLILPSRAAARLVIWSPVWLFVVPGAIGLWLAGRTHRSSRTLLAVTAVTIVVGAFGFVMVRLMPASLPFFLHRSLAFLYVPGYAGCTLLAEWTWRHGGAARRVVAAALAAGMLANALPATALGRRLTGHQRPEQSEDYLALVDWARSSTPATSRFLIPMYGQTTFYAFRVLADRAAFLHRSIGELVLINPKAALAYLRMAADIEPLTSKGRDTSEWLRVARKYGADYIIVESSMRSPPELPVRYRNKSFIVFTAVME